MSNVRVHRLGALCAGIAALVLGRGAAAEAPTAVHLQGLLASSGGAPVSDGKYPLTFTLYAAQTGGIALWTEVIPSVIVTAGRFEAALGVSDPQKPFPASKLASESEIWLSIRVYDDPDLPRVRLLAVPYAIEALHAKSAETAKSADNAKNAESATKATDVDCTACVSVAELVFDAPVDLKGNALAAGAITSSSTVKAVAFEGDGSKLSGIKIPQGACQNGQFATGIDTNGDLVCSTIPTAGDVSCTGCITPEKVAFQYAGSDSKGGPALAAYDVTCTGCVTVDEIAFDKDVDLGAKKLATSGTVSAASFIGDGSKLSGIKIPAGSCASGKVLTGLNADGTLVCTTFAITPGSLPNDGIDEVSNGLLKNQFNYVNAGKTNIPIPDYNLAGVSDTIAVPNNLGLAQKLTVTVNLTKSYSGIEKEFTLKLVDPNNKSYILHDPTSTLSGATLNTTYPEPTKTISGDLTAWIGQNPGTGTNGGKWMLTAIDNAFDNKPTDGQINAWSINVQVVSNSQIQLAGDLIVDGALTGGKTLNVAGAATFGAGATFVGGGVFGGSLQVGNDTSSCGTGKFGAIRWTGKQMDVCGAAGWEFLWGPTAPAKSKADARVSCKAIRDANIGTGDGLYWIAPDGNPNNAYETWCDMTTASGGWTLVMNVHPADGSSVSFTNTLFWQGTTPIGQAPYQFNMDYKNSGAWSYSATAILIAIAKPGLNGDVIGWKAWNMGARTLNSFFTGGQNATQTSSVIASNVGAVYPYEAVIKNGNMLQSNRNINPNADRVRLGVDGYSAQGDDNQPGLGTQMNENSCGGGVNCYRFRDVELWVNSGSNLWCSSPGNGSWKWIGTDGGCAYNCGNCDGYAGPGYSPYWTYRIYVRE